MVEIPSPKVGCFSQVETTSGDRWGSREMRKVADFRFRWDWKPRQKFSATLLSPRIADSKNSSKKHQKTTIMVMVWFATALTYYKLTDRRERYCIFTSPSRNATFFLEHSSIVTYVQHLKVTECQKCLTRE